MTRSSFAALLRRTDPTAPLLSGVDASSGALTVRHGTDGGGLALPATV